MKYLNFLVVYYRKSRDSIIASPHMFIKYFDDIHNHIFSPPPCYMCACLVCLYICEVGRSHRSPLLYCNLLFETESLPEHGPLHQLASTYFTSVSILNFLEFRRSQTAFRMFSETGLMSIRFCRRSHCYH